MHPGTPCKSDEQRLLQKVDDFQRLSSQQLYATSPIFSFDGAHLAHPCKEADSAAHPWQQTADPSHRDLFVNHSNPCSQTSGAGYTATAGACTYPASDNHPAGPSAAQPMLQGCITHDCYMAATLTDNNSRPSSSSVTAASEAGPAAQTLTPSYQNSASLSPRQSCSHTARSSSNTNSPRVSMSPSEKLLFTDEVELTPPHLLQGRVTAVAASSAGSSPWQALAAIYLKEAPAGLANRSVSSPFASAVDGTAVSPKCTRRTTTGSIPYPKRANSNMMDDPAVAGILRRRRTAADYVKQTSNSRQSLEQQSPVGCRGLVDLGSHCPAGQGNLQAARSLQPRMSSKNSVQFALPEVVDTDESLQPKLRRGTPYPHSDSCTEQQQQQQQDHPSDSSSNRRAAAAQSSQQVTSSRRSSDVQAAKQAQCADCQCVPMPAVQKTTASSSASSSLQGSSSLPIAATCIGFGTEAQPHCGSTRQTPETADCAACIIERMTSVRFQVVENQGAGEVCRQPSFVRKGTPIPQRPDDTGANTQQQATLSTAKSCVHFLLPEYDHQHEQGYDSTCREHDPTRDPTPFRSHSAEQPVCVRFTVAAGRGAGEVGGREQRYHRQPTPFVGRADPDLESCKAGLNDGPSSADTVHVRFLVSGRGAGEGDGGDHRPIVRTPTPFVGRAEGGSRVVMDSDSLQQQDDPCDGMLAPSSPAGSPPHRTNSCEISLTGGSNTSSNQSADSTLEPLQSLSPAHSDRLQPDCSASATAAVATGSCSSFCSNGCTAATLQVRDPDACAANGLKQSMTKLSVAAPLAEVHIPAASL